MLRSTLSMTTGVVLFLVACGGAAAPASTAAVSPSASAAAAAKASAPGSAAASAAAKPSSGASAAAPASGAAAVKPEKAKISIARSAQGGSFIPIMIAKEAGYFAKYGLDADLILVAPPAANAALASGTLDIYEGATSVITAILGGAEFEYVAAPVDRNSQVLLGKPGFTTFQSLRGKSIATISAGSFGDIAARWLAKKEGMVPGKDFTLIYHQTPEAAMATFDKGDADAALVTPPYSDVLKAKGDPVIFDFYNSDFRVVGPGTAVSRKFRQQNPNTIRAFLMGYLEGVKRTFEDEAYAKQLDAKYAKFDDPKLIDPDYAQAVRVLNKNLTIKPEAIQVALDGSDDPKAKTAKVADFYDNTIIDEVNKDFGSKLFPDDIK